MRSVWGLAPGAEVTTEANPDSVDAAYLAHLADAGFTRVSFGMQSAVPSVLATLERTHDPARVPLVVRWARDAGLDVSLDLIYGTPGESLADWRASLEPAIGQAPDHLSAYSLIVEEGTKLARQIRRGEVAQPDDDLQAEFYELADELLGAAGYSWYEVSNWATDDAHRSRHNLAYWRSRTGGASGPARTATSAGCAGGTSSTRRPTPTACWPGCRRPPAARPSTTRPGRWNGCCCGAASVRASRSRRCLPPDGTRSPDSSPTNSSTARPPSPARLELTRRGGCWRMPSSGGCSTTEAQLTNLIDIG